VAAVEAHLLSQQARGDADANRPRAGIVRDVRWRGCHKPRAALCLPLPPPAVDVASLAVPAWFE
jgi:hypothetical protein